MFIVTRNSLKNKKNKRMNNWDKLKVLSKRFKTCFPLKIIIQRRAYSLNLSNYTKKKDLFIKSSITPSDFLLASTKNT